MVDNVSVDMEWIIEEEKIVGQNSLQGSVVLRFPARIVMRKSVKWE
jgi:hypothetical protein